jgi:branched-chain amino acid transport system ATP-binding protein
MGEKPLNTILEIESLSHQFGGLKVLTDFRLSLGSFELIGLIGPNGSGKTTVFNMITGVYRPDHGSIRYNGKSLIGPFRPFVCTRSSPPWRTFAWVRTTT